MSVVQSKGQNVIKGCRHEDDGRKLQHLANDGINHLTILHNEKNGIILLVKSTRSNATFGPGRTAIRLRRSTFCTAGESLKASLAGRVRQHSAYVYWATLQQYQCSYCPLHMPTDLEQSVPPF